MQPHLLIEFPSIKVDTMADDSELDASKPNGGAQLPSNGDAPPPAPPRGSKRTKRVSWREDLEESRESETTTGPVASAQAVSVTLPEISELWWNEEGLDDGRENKEPRNELERWQFKVRSFVDHLSIRAVGIILIFLDIVLLIIDLSIGTSKTKTSQLVFDGISLTLSCVFMLDLFARIFAYGFKKFFGNPWEVADAVIVVSTFVVTVVYTALDEVLAEADENGYGKLIKLARALRVIRVARIFYSQRQMKKSSRQTVSQNKRRYRKDGFDLDLTYVTDRVIAMSFPSSGLQSVFRNPIKEVSRFFNTKHKGNYRIYNLCSERSYDTSYFDDQVSRVMIDDHNVPTITDLLKFVADAKEWMTSDENHVIAIHCKGGKGRTGTCVSAWLIESGQFDNAKEALHHFGSRRTDMEVGLTFQGVETASQIRYVGYFERIKKEFEGLPPPRKEIRLKTVTIKSIEGVGRGNGSDLSMNIVLDGKEVIMCQFAEEYNCKIRHDATGNQVVCDVTNCPILCGDVKIRFTSTARNLPVGYDHCAFYFWVNTSFLDGTNLTVKREEIDNPHKPKTWEIFKDDFAIVLEYDEIKDGQ